MKPELAMFVLEIISMKYFFAKTLTCTNFLPLKSYKNNQTNIFKLQNKTIQIKLPRDWVIQILAVSTTGHP